MVALLGFSANGHLTSYGLRTRLNPHLRCMTKGLNKAFFVVLKQHQGGFHQETLAAYSRRALPNQIDLTSGPAYCRDW